jgi:hypothetical protein
MSLSNERVSLLRSIVEDLSLDEKVEAEPTHTLKVGAILVSSWGYDQTNIDFYEVVQLVGSKMVAVRKIEQEIVKSNGPSDEVMPVPGSYKGPVLRKKVGSSNQIGISSYSSASPWGGKPEHQTGWGYGH